ncbi:MAG TPA: hypoxanthine phosphoribosyltransferase [Acidimicrobiia bacterium]|nr:hypoxanthine phosphoribosyltransferase [Acidimicrobiia bacterium]
MTSGTATGPKPWMDAAEVAETVTRLAAEIDRDHPDGVVLIGVLKGSLFFLADLSRAITVPCEVDFMAISHFAPDSGRVKIVKDLEGDIAGRAVVVVEDVVDTGLTLSYLLGQLAARHPTSLEVCALLDRSRRRIVPLPTRYCGVVIDDEFMLGYGLDYGERYRNHPGLVVGDLRVLERDPDAYVSNLYGREEA